MRTAISDLEDFYEAEIGALVADIVAEKLRQAWGDAKGLRVVGFGHTAPFFSPFTAADRCAAVVPQGMGVRAGGETPTCLVADHHWPLPDASVDRLVLIHGLEEVPDPRRLMREAWRVMADDGLLIIAVANRRGPWSLVETSPFAAGRPYSRRQLDQLLADCLFQPTAHATALHFPPVASSALLRLAKTWERLGGALDELGWFFLPNLAGLNLVEARKSTALPIGGAKADLFRPGRLTTPVAGIEPSRSHGRDSKNSAASERKFGNSSLAGENALGVPPLERP
ncbi:MAG: methyltransferase domain-containing protein [Pseudomonadota bacterium]